jgi:hypothetical protein
VNIFIEKHPNHTTIFIKNHWHIWQLIFVFVILWAIWNMAMTFFFRPFIECGWSLNMLMKNESGIAYLCIMLVWILATLHLIQSIVHQVFGGETIQVGQQWIKVGKRYHFGHRVWRYNPEKMLNISLSRTETEDILKKMPSFIANRAGRHIYFDYPGEKRTFLNQTNLSASDAEFILQTLLDLDVIKPEQLAKNK